MGSRRGSLFTPYHCNSGFSIPVAGPSISGNTSRLSTVTCSFLDRTLLFISFKPSAIWNTRQSANEGKVYSYFEYENLYLKPSMVDVHLQALFFQWQSAFNRPLDVFLILTKYQVLFIHIKTLNKEILSVFKKIFVSRISKKLKWNV